jgi:hypothetical protein
MNKGSTAFLKAVIYILGLAALGVLLVAVPIGISSDQTGYYRPILIGMYIPAIPFFIALYEALKLLSFIDNNTAFSQLSVKALHNIKYCGMAISVLYALGMPYIYYAADMDDAPGVLAIGLVIVFASIVIAVFAAVLQRLLHNAIEIKTENDLTV